MKILETGCYYHRNKNKTKDDILDIGKALNVFKSYYSFSTKDNGILITWRNSYKKIDVIYDIDRIAQVLKIVEMCNVYWRNAKA